MSRNVKLAKSKVKVAVYSIALNEESFVTRWAQSARDADLIVLGDTGSTDGTVERALAAGVKVVPLCVKPWRFDDARNALLASIPGDIDYCIALDLDEVLLPGWKPELQDALEHEITRPRYVYTWSWQDAEHTLPGLQYLGDKIHSRGGYRWIHPVHETLTRYGNKPSRDGQFELQIHHHPDNSKSRSQYLPLLEMAAAERPKDSRCLYYLAREYSFHGRPQQAIERLSQCLYDLDEPMWPPERAAARRLLATLQPERAEMLLKQAIEDAPGRREALVDLAQWYYDKKDWPSCRRYAEQALAIKEKPLDYLCEAFAWGATPHDLAAIACHWLGDADAALKHGQRALELNHTDPRLIGNMAFYTKS